MMTLFLISLLLAACGGLLLWDYASNIRRQAVLRRLAAISSPLGNELTGGSTTIAGPLLSQLGFLESHFEILGWRYSDKKLVYTGLALVLILGIQSFLYGLIAALPVTAAIALAMVKGLAFLANRKASAFVDEFSGFVDRLRQLVIAGNSATIAFDKALKNCSPLQYRFLNPVSALVSHGVPLYDALQNRSARLNIPELFLFTAIIRTNMRFGGDLSSSLSHFESPLLNRVRAKKEFRAMTSELRMTTLILMLLPFVAGIGIFFSNRRYIEFFVTAPQGAMAIVYIGGSIALGFYLINKLTKVRY
jgi:tight adherence protein B